TRHPREPLARLFRTREAEPRREPLDHGPLLDRRGRGSFSLLERERAQVALGRRDRHVERARRDARAGVRLEERDRSVAVEVELARRQAPTRPILAAQRVEEVNAVALLCAALGVRIAAGGRAIPARREEPAAVGGRALLRVGGLERELREAARVAG